MTDFTKLPIDTRVLIAWDTPQVGHIVDRPGYAKGGYPVVVSTDEGGLYTFTPDGRHVVGEDVVLSLVDAVVESPVEQPAREFKVGNVVRDFAHPEYGEGKVVAAYSGNYNWPVIVSFGKYRSSYTLEGRSFACDPVTLFHVDSPKFENSDQVEEQPALPDPPPAPVPPVVPVAPGTASRYNSNKPRHALIPAYALRELAKVYTIGAEKYTRYDDGGKLIEDGSYNWRRGMSWMSVMDSVERHIAKFKHGSDFDTDYPPDLLAKHGQTYHLANAAWGLFTLLEYYKIYPQGDDRRHWYDRPLKRVWLDIDDVICDFSRYFIERLGLPAHDPTDWDDWRFRKNLDRVDDDFWISAPALVDPLKITYPISGYCTKRRCSTELVEQWLEKNGFPCAEVINVGLDGSKAEALRDRADVMIDDSIRNFAEINAAGITCYLATRPHNAKYDVGHLRVAGVEGYLEIVRRMA